MRCADELRCGATQGAVVCGAMTRRRPVPVGLGHSVGSGQGGGVPGSRDPPDRISSLSYRSSADTGHAQWRRDGVACGFMRCGVLHQGAHAAVRPTCWVVEHGNGVRAGRGTAGDRCTRHLPCDVSTHMAAGVATSPAAVGPRITRGAAREAQWTVQNNFHPKRGGLVTLWAVG